MSCQRPARILFWIATAAVLVLTLMPAQFLPEKAGSRCWACWPGRIGGINGACWRAW